MFGQSGKKAKLEKKYQKLMEEAFQLSHTNRIKSDEKTAEAEEVRKSIAAIEQKLAD